MTQSTLLPVYHLKPTRTLVARVLVGRMAMATSLNAMQALARLYVAAVFGGGRWALGTPLQSWMAQG